MDENFTLQASFCEVELGINPYTKTHNQHSPLFFILTNNWLQYQKYCEKSSLFEKSSFGRPERVFL